MNIRLINLALLVSFSVCYLEWGGDHSSFIFEIEKQLFTSPKAFANNLIHPVVLLAFTGQILLLMSAILRKPYTFINTLAVILSSAIVALFITVGVMAQNMKIVSATLPFVTFVVLYFWQVKKRKIKNIEKE